MPLPSPYRILCRNLAPRLVRDDRGATAVEFGLVALPFLALLGAIIQVAFTIWAQQNFDYVFQQAIRDVFTGKFQTSNSQSGTDATLLAALRANMCPSGSSAKPIIFDCSGVKLDVSLGSSFASSAPPTVIDPTTRDWSSSFGTSYTCAGPSTIVVATAAVKFPVFLGLANAGLSDFADGSTLLESTAVFRTEPYSAGGAPPC